MAYWRCKISYFTFNYMKKNLLFNYLLYLSITAVTAKTHSLTALTNFNLTVIVEHVIFSVITRSTQLHKKKLYKDRKVYRQMSLIFTYHRMQNSHTANHPKTHRHHNSHSNLHNPVKVH